MTTLVKLALISSATLLSFALTPAAFAGDTLEIRDFIGSINWSNGPMAVDVQQNREDTKISGSRSVTIDGGLENVYKSKCKSSNGQFKFKVYGEGNWGSLAGYRNLEDFPVLNITVPADTKLIISNSAVFTEGSPNIEEADLHFRLCGRVSLGSVGNILALDNRGSADTRVGNSGHIEANLRGSGDFTGENSGDVLINSGGSGNIALGDVRSLEFSNSGSGDLDVGDIRGSAVVTASGSGDVDIGDIQGSAKMKGSGSGDIKFENLDGSLIYARNGSGRLSGAFVTGPQLDITANGSGDITIDGGQVEDLDVRTNGSANTRYSGAAKTANLTSSGSGNIRVGRVTGEVQIKSSGSGKVKINNRE